MLFRLSFKYLIKNIRRSIILIACIASVFVFLLSRALIEKNSSYNEMLFAQKMYSGYDVSFNNVDKYSVEKIKNVKGVKKIISTDYLGNYSYKNGVSFDLSDFNDEYFKINRFKLIKGRLPNSSDEIILEKRAVKEMGLENSLDKYVEFSNIVEDNKNSRIELSASKKNLKIVGVIDRDRIFYDSAYKLTAFTKGNIVSSDSISKNNSINGFLVFAQNANQNAIYEEVVKKSDLNFNDMRLNDKLSRSKREFNEVNSFSKYKEAILICLASILLI